MTKLPEKAKSAAELRREMQELYGKIEYANFLLGMGNIIEIEPTSSQLKRFVEIGVQLRERGEKVEFEIGHWDPRLHEQLEILFPRLGELAHQRWLKAQLMKKHGDKLRRKRQGRPKLPGKKPARKRLPR